MNTEPKTGYPRKNPQLDRPVPLTRIADALRRHRPDLLIITGTSAFVALAGETGWILLHR